MPTSEAPSDAERAEHDARFRAAVRKGTKGVPPGTVITGSV